MAVHHASAEPAHGETVAHIVARLRDDILGRRVGPGERLVESELTSRFAVSRGSIREALRRLAAEGFIEHMPNRGAIVRRLTLQEIGELFQIRTELEALAARLAAGAATEPPARARFEAAIAPIFDERAREPCAYLVENAEFHGAVMTLGGNRQLRDLALRLHLPLIMAQAAEALTPQALAASVREHRAIAAAILAADPVAADAAMRAHLGRAADLACARAPSGENRPAVTCASRP
ncbi:MAG TPA: GntR family transcriptional regulator [Roseiarcus sp.]|nr:GntR family transcriptional regulator [Roseiarcus sp.]